MRIGLKTNKIIISKFPQYSFCRETKKLFRSASGTDRPCFQNKDGSYTLKKNGKGFRHTISDLLRMTDFAAGQYNFVKKVG